MEKPGCTHPLCEIKAQMVSVDAMNLTFTAQGDIRRLGISKEQALEVVQRIAAEEFHKSMESEKRPGCWQDVYFPWFLGMKLYVKFGRDEPDGEYTVISFKENTSGW
jgi:motility quorum-sensing regulator / GCU-specific mRNA interferase toxin